MRKKHLLVVGLLVASTTLGALVACSSDDTPASPSSSPASSGTTDPQTITVRISAATGGTIEDKAGYAKLSIPPDAISSDTDITVKITPKTGGGIADIAEFGPDGLHFFKPATLELKGDPSLAPEGKYVAVGEQSGGDFAAVPGSAFANGVAKANVDYLRRFTLVTVAWLVDPANCQDAWSKFVPCGGDPTGTWLFTHICYDNSAFDQLNTAACPQEKFSGEGTSARELTFNGTTSTLSEGLVTATYSIDFPLSCPVLSDGGVAAACTDYNDPPSVTCSDTGGGQCHLEWKDMGTIPALTEPFKTSGATWSNGDGSKSGQYCVSGDILYYNVKGPNGGLGTLNVLSRKK